MGNYSVGRDTSLRFDDNSVGDKLCWGILMNSAGGKKNFIEDDLFVVIS